MAIVKTITSGSAVVRIDDSLCRGLDREETARRWAAVDRAATRIARAHAKGPASGSLNHSPAEGREGERTP